jgi:hypothetical protein
LILSTSRRIKDRLDRYPKMESVESKVLDTDSQDNFSQDNVQTDFQTGDHVRLTTIPPYFKTAESIPMLRPPNVVQLDEEGVILGRDPGDMWRVKFIKGAYLLDQQYLERIEPQQLDSKI